MAKDQIRENRIKDQILADAYNSEERAIGWYEYLGSSINFPFSANWQQRNRETLDIQLKQVKVLGLAKTYECKRNMSVEVAYSDDIEEKDVFSVSLSKIEAIDADEQTQEALADWQYWVERGYKF